MSKQQRKKEKNIFEETDKRNDRVHIVVSRYWPDGKRFRRRCPNKTVASNLLARINGAIATGMWKELRDELNKKPKKTLTIDEFSDLYLDKHCRAYNTRPDFKVHALKPIRRIIGKVPLTELRRGDAFDFIDERSEEVAAATVNRSLAVLKNMLSYAFDKGYIETHPLMRFKMLPEDQVALRVMTLFEERKLVQATLQEDLVIGTYVGILGETGLRKTEGLSLKRHFVSLDQRMLTVEASKNGKTRRVPLTEYAVELFRLLYKARPNGTYCFVQENGRPWKNPRGPFEAARSKLNMGWVGFHGFRHFRATEWISDGMTVEKVQGLLDHQDIKTTMRYVHYIAENAKDAVRNAEENQLRRLRAYEEQATNRQPLLTGVR